MTGRLPWFRCFPAPLLGALAGMEAYEGYVYVVTLLRIHEMGGPVAETSRSLARRTGLPERKVVAALESLFEAGKLQRLTDGRLDSPSTHGEIAWQEERRDGQSKAGRASAAKRAAKHGDGRELAAIEKGQQKQRTASTSAERPSNHKEEDREKEKEEEKEATTALRSAERPPLGGGRAAPSARPENRTRGRGSTGSAVPVEQVWVEVDTPQWFAWCDHFAACGEKPPKAHPSRWHPGEGYAFPAEWPPSLGYREAAE